MIRLKYQDKSYRILNDYSLNYSSREVKFSSITIDSTDMKIEDLPVKYQKIEIVEDDRVLLTGFLDSYTLPKMKNQTEFREMEITLLSPMQMATNRTCTILGTYTLENLISMIFQPLVDDGFRIVEKDFGSEQQYTATFGFETIENAMNYVSNSKNLWWYIDESCGIHIRDINSITNQTPKRKISHEKKENGLYELTPSVESLDYANKINIKNARIYLDYNTPLQETKVLEPNTVYEFNYPIDISVENAKKLANESSSSTIIMFQMNPYNESQGLAYILQLSLGEDGSLEISDKENISFSDDDEQKLFVFQKDNFFKNLITGIKYTGSSNLIVHLCRSYTSLKKSTVQFFENDEIEKNKNKISNSGVIERTFDLNEKWFTTKEIIEYAKTLIGLNGSQTNIINLSYDIEQDMEIGDLIRIELENYLSIGDFIITDKTVNFSNGIKKYTYTMRNSNFLENYIDLFRAEITEIEDQTLEDMLYIEYSSDQFNLKSEVFKI